MTYIIEKFVTTKEGTNALNTDAVYQWQKASENTYPDYNEAKESASKLPGCFPDDRNERIGYRVTDLGNGKNYAVNPE